MQPLGVALVGCGTVGSAVVKLLLDEGPRLAKQAGRPLALRHVIVREPSKNRGIKVPGDLLGTDVRAALTDEQVHVLIEVIGGLEPARQIIRDAFKHGKHVVTANKAVLATHGDELFAAAHAAGRALLFEASVGGGIPIVHALTQALTANRVLALKGILNGTTNYILTEMTERGLDYQTALSAAQANGFAEADPTLDVDGTDAAQKLAILARLAFGVSLRGEEIERRGIDRIEPIDLSYAREMGYVIKLIAEAWGRDQKVALHVEPTLVRRYDPLAEVRGPYNAIEVVGDCVRDMMFLGPGAGALPTASAVVGDLIDLAVGRAQPTFESLRLWAPDPRVALRSPAEIVSRFYLRTTVLDRPGVLALVAGALGEEGISIASVVQHEAIETPADGRAVPVVIVTHYADLGAMRRAVKRIDSQACTVTPSTYYPVAE